MSPRSFKKSANVRSEAGTVLMSMTPAVRDAASKPAITAQKPAAAERRSEAARKLSYKEQRELEALPEKIEALEAEQARLHAATSDPKFYQQPGDKIAATLERMGMIPEPD